MAEDIDVRRLRLQPGDSVLVRMPDQAFTDASDAGARRIVEALRATLDKAGHHGVPILGVSYDVEVSTVAGDPAFTVTVGVDAAASLDAVAIGELIKRQVEDLRSRREERR